MIRLEMKNYNMILTERSCGNISITSEKIDKYEYLTDGKMLLPDQRKAIEQVTFTYSALGKALEKQIKTIEKQREKQIRVFEGHGKQLLKSSGEKESSVLLKQKQLANERMGEIQNLSKQISFKNLLYYFKSNSDPKRFIGFKDPLAFYKIIRDGYTTLEVAEGNKKK